MALFATLAVLLAHASFYTFLTDDAYISFRYARNLADGYGLVFNPGFERVEGYTNFLWVLILAGCQAIGLRPEVAAPILSMASTVAMWAVIVAFAQWSAPESGAWVVLPVLLLGMTRSVAVWSTSGLETRLFELLVVAGVLRLVVERRELGSGARRVRPLAALLLGLATLTRPDGLLIAVGCLAAVIVHGRRTLRKRVGWLTRSACLYGAIVASHFLFRYAYYGQWLPNTYEAKVGGRTSWAMGVAYLESFALEYALYLWLPFLVAAVVCHRRRGTSFVPLVFAAVIVPHAVYVAAIGGDHFEYRPLDLYFPFLYLLVFHGVVYLMRYRRARAVVAVGLLVMALGIVELPWLSHAQFPQDYEPGFPGKAVAKREDAERFLEPGHGLLYRLPGFRSVALRHQQLVRLTTSYFVAIRQEEHERFLDTAISEARELEALIDRGVLPADTYVAIDCVGAIPYYTRLRVLDRLGLTDRHVARSEFKTDIMAHGKYATRDYARERGVDLWAVSNVHLLWKRDPSFYHRLIRLNRREREEHFAKVGDGLYLLAWLPQGIDQARRRFPALRFESTRDVEAIRRVGLGTD